MLPGDERRAKDMLDATELLLVSVVGGNIVARLSL